MSSKFKKAVRPVIWTKVLLASPSGGGKTFTALRVATGIRNAIKKASGKDVKIAFIGSESQRDLIYANEFEYDILQLEAPFTPESYVDAINDAISEGYEILVVDSLTHEWSGTGGVLDIHGKIPGNSYTAWQKVTPRHNEFLDAIIESPIHVIATVRGKDEVVLEDVNGKQVPKKVGLGYDQRNNLEYLFTVSFNIDRDTHVASEFKDNTHLFEGRARVLSEKDGEALYKWASDGDDSEIIKRAKDLAESKETGKQLMKEAEKQEAEELEKTTPRRPQTQKVQDDEDLPFEPDIKPEVKAEVKTEPKQDGVVEDNVDAYSVWKDAYTKAKARGLKIAEIKAIISPSGTESPKADTPSDVLLKAATLLNQV